MKKNILRKIISFIVILLPTLVFSQIKYVALDVPQQEIQRCLTNISENQDFENLLIYPNPSCKGEINITIPSNPNETPVFIDIYNINGVKVYNKKYMPEEMMNPRKIRLQALSNGIYLVIISSGDAVHKTKVTLLQDN
jgi:hypothetical protein